MSNTRTQIETLCNIADALEDNMQDALNAHTDVRTLQDFYNIGQVVESAAMHLDYLRAGDAMLLRVVTGTMQDTAGAIPGLLTSALEQWQADLQDSGAWEHMQAFIAALPE